MIKCIDCERPATRVLVNDNHDIIDYDAVYCEKHAFDEGREKCSCCEYYWISFNDKIKLLPTFPAGTLDEGGCCPEHP